MYSLYIITESAACVNRFLPGVRRRKEQIYRVGSTGCTMLCSSTWAWG